MITTYEVTARLDGRLWLIEIPSLNGATQAQNVDEVEAMAIDYIAAVQNIPEADVAIALTIVD